MDPLQPAGIVERLVRDDTDRKRFLKAVGAGGAASFGAFVLAACGSSGKEKVASAASASTTTSSSSSTTSAAAAGGDLAIVNYALTLEYLESEFYAKVAAAGLFKGATLSLLKTFGGEESEHVAALEAVAEKLGKPAAKPTGKFPLENATQVAKLAYTVENLGASAYLGQAPRIQSAEVLAAALSIHTVEARHAASLGTLVKESVTPNGAFAVPASMSTVLEAVKPFIA
ncbi:MAG: ferritin-like domain-containing protein [Solirubrobacteraceae bacterium]